MTRDDHLSAIMAEERDREGPPTEYTRSGCLVGLALCVCSALVAAGLVWGLWSALAGVMIGGR